jgi:hypothetical protein
MFPSIARNLVGFPFDIHQEAQALCSDNVDRVDAS